jgi:hypothetical protein
MGHDRASRWTLKALFIPANPDHATDRMIIPLTNPRDPMSVNVDTAKAVERRIGGLLRAHQYTEASAWVSEQGRLYGLPNNARANHWLTATKADALATPRHARRQLFGDIVITGPPTAESGYTSLSEHVVSFFDTLNVEPLKAVYNDSLQRLSQPPPPDAGAGL